MEKLGKRQMRKVYKDLFGKTPKQSLQEHMTHLYQDMQRSILSDFDCGNLYHSISLTYSLSTEDNITMHFRLDKEQSISHQFYIQMIQHRQEKS